MTGNRCIVCRSTRAKDPGVSFHRFPADPALRAKWISKLELDADVVKPHSRVCSRHFPGGDATKEPQLNLGKRFASPRKKDHPRAKRAKARDASKDIPRLTSASKSPGSSRSVTPAFGVPVLEPVLTVSVGEQLEQDYQVHELPSESVDDMSVSEASGPIQTSGPGPTQSTEVLVNTALIARIEALEAERCRLEKQLSSTEAKRRHFRMEHIQHDDKLVHFYTGFVSFFIFGVFFQFLGPVVNNLHYWGTQSSQHQRHCTRKLDPKNQLFMTLVKLKLNLKLTDLAFRFGISKSLASRYITTWISFLYHYLKEIDWMPSVEQVAGTLPHSFQTKYPNTFAIIDGSEIFLETPSDLHMQSSTWSQYKHHNTVKFLVACTPNGAISFVSPLYVGSISDVELTRVCGFLTKLEDKPGISIMADRGFTVKDMLKALNIELNIPPFMEGRKQLPAKEVQEGRRIASLRIHVERAIGRMKTFSILKGTLPISMARLANQIVCVCGFLSNFHPALVPPAEQTLDSDVEDYFQSIGSSDEHSGDSSVGEDEDD